ncbi:MAG TPA: DUF1127 domain-containing protein [Acetobacteraceae bacterium]|jgi:uncharacterized protein YjiS (DUF1127 family)
MRSTVRRFLNTARNGRVARRMGFAEWLEIIAGQRSLLDLDDRQLRDIGLTRDQATAINRGEWLPERTEP